MQKYLKGTDNLPIVIFAEVISMTEKIFPTKGFFWHFEGKEVRHGWKRKKG